ncbi:hypothetical protein Hanom_Chr08g00708021 [Helianthus anomalus]
MAGTSSPQFMIVCSATTFASRVIYFSGTVLHVIIIISTMPHIWFLIRIMLGYRIRVGSSGSGTNRHTHTHTLAEYKEHENLCSLVKVTYVHGLQLRFHFY